MMPETGEVYDRAIEPGTAYRVEAVGWSSGKIYLRLLVDGTPTPSTLEWSPHRWGVLVAREGLELVR